MTIDTQEIRIKMADIPAQPKHRGSKPAAIEQIGMKL
jgi:hypothetical protein